MKLTSQISIADQTADNAPFGGWAHYNKRQEAAAQKVRAHNERFDFIAEMNVISEAEVLEILIKKYKMSGVLFSMVSILSQNITNRYKNDGKDYNSKVASIDSVSFLQKCYPSLMSEIQVIEASYKVAKALDCTIKRDVYEIEQLTKLS
tara:strand:+ start:101 stop:547 length:447 start_codon:yes stop_codon:yes gene_type:complete